MNLRQLDFRRMDYSGDLLQVTYYINVSSPEQLIRAQDSLEKTLSGEFGEYCGTKQLARRVMKYEVPQTG